MKIAAIQDMGYIAPLPQTKMFHWYRVEFGLEVVVQY